MKVSRETGDAIYSHSYAAQVPIPRLAFMLSTRARKLEITPDKESSADKKRLYRMNLTVSLLKLLLFLVSLASGGDQATIIAPSKAKTNSSVIGELHMVKL